MLKCKSLNYLFIGILLVLTLNFISAYTAPTFDSVNLTLSGNYTAPDFSSVNFTLGESESDIDYIVALDLGFLRFLNCSPDFENPCSIPEGQSASINSINATNNGTGTADLQIRINPAAATGWTLFASPESDLSNNLTLGTDWQTIYSSVGRSPYRQIWLFANCSFISSNPRTNIEMRVWGD